MNRINSDGPASHATATVGTDTTQAPGVVIVLTGPPGAGKSTVAPLVADDLLPSVHLHCDDFWSAIHRGGIAPYLPEAHRQNEVVMSVIVQAAFGYASGGYQVVVDGVVGPWFLDVFRAEGRARGIPLHYLVLRPDLDTTLRRAVGRGKGTLTAPDPIRSLHEQFSDLGPLERHVLDSSGLDPVATKEYALDGIARRAYLLDPAPPHPTEP